MPEQPINSGPPEGGSKPAKLDDLLKDPAFLKSVLNKAISLDSNPERQRKEQERQRSIDTVCSNVRGLSAANLRGEIVTDVAWASVITERHARLRIAQKVSEVLEFGDHECRNALRDQFEKRGGFFDDYSVELVTDRLTNHASPGKEGWISSVAWGQIYDKDLNVIPEPIVGGDVQLYVPVDRKDAILPAEITLDPRKDFIDPENEEIFELIARNPQIAAWLSDVASDRDVVRPDGRKFSVHGFAKTATDTAFSFLQKLNLLREFPVQFVVAAIAQIVGVRNEKGEVIRKLKAPMLSKQSRDLHTRERKKAGVLLPTYSLGIKRQTFVPVMQADGRINSVELDWEFLAMKQAVPGQNVFVSVPDGVPSPSGDPLLPGENPVQPAPGNNGDQRQE